MERGKSMAFIWSRCDHAPYSDRPPGGGVAPEGGKL